MEILIVGGIIVALMVYASTKIKNEAKRAYEREEFVAERFKITKPDDFIIPISENAQFLFEAYSKEYSDEDDSEDLRQCWATVVSPASSDATENNDERIKLFVKTLTDAATEETFEARVRVVKSYEERYAEAINLMIKSFVLR